MKKVILLLTVSIVSLSLCAKEGISLADIYNPANEGAKVVQAQAAKQTLKLYVRNMDASYRIKISTINLVPVASDIWINVVAYLEFTCDGVEYSSDVEAFIVKMPAGTNEVNYDINPRCGGFPVTITSIDWVGLSKTSDDTYNYEVIY